jgi:hypothetical protein
MNWQRYCSLLLAGTLVAAASNPARAQEPAKADEKKAEAVPAPAPAQHYCTVCCTEWVKVNCPKERTVHKVEYRHEKYTAFKCECVAVQKTRTCVYHEMVPEKRIETRIVCKCVPVEEERTVMETHVVCKPVVKTVRKCVDKGHWECKLVECKPSCWERLCDCFRHKDECCEPKCPKYKTKKVWCPNKVWEEHQVTCMQKVKECRAVKVKCTVHKMVKEEQKVEVTCYKCVAKERTENYTVHEVRKVPYEATRCVKVCVPVKEMVDCWKWEKRTVVKKVPCEPCCEPCPKKCCGGLFHRHHKDDCCH